jgi:hypothetical protein
MKSWRKIGWRKIARHKQGFVLFEKTEQIDPLIYLRLAHSSFAAAQKDRFGGVGKRSPADAYVQC